MVWSIQLLDMGVTHHLEYERIMGIIVVGAWVYFLSLGSITYKHIFRVWRYIYYVYVYATFESYF